jgi:NTE family protein
MGRSQGPVAFVLQGGAALTAPQVGMLRALKAAGIAPDLLVGSSAGALNAVAFASHPTSTGLDNLTALWAAMRRRDVLSLSVRQLALAAAGRRDGLSSDAGLRRLLERCDLPRVLDETVIPVHVAVTDVATGDPVLLSRGETVTALLASCAFPGVYAPVTTPSGRYYDGGVATDTPVRYAEMLGAGVVYVLPAATPAASDSRGAFGMSMRALGQLLAHASRAEIAGARGDVRVLPAPTTPTPNPFSFAHTGRLIDEGFALARFWLAADQPSLVAA